MIADDNDLVQLVVAVLAGLGALNWGLVEFFETDLLVDVLSLDGDLLTVALLAIGAAGAVLLINLADEHVLEA